jgi:hypothetical protein
MRLAVASEATVIMPGFSLVENTAAAAGQQSAAGQLVATTGVAVDHAAADHTPLVYNRSVAASAAPKQQNSTGAAKTTPDWRGYRAHLLNDSPSQHHQQWGARCLPTGPGELSR